MSYKHYYNQYKDKVYSYFFYHLGNNRALAEDLTSDTFLKGFENFDRYDENYQFSTWIYTIARNILYDHYRKNKQDISLQETGQLGLEAFLGYEQDFHRSLQTQQDMQEFYAAIKHIPVIQKDMILLKYLQELSTKEISKMTGKNEASIRKTLSRGLQALAGIMQAPNS